MPCVPQIYVCHCTKMCEEQAMTVDERGSIIVPQILVGNIIAQNHNVIIDEYEKLYLDKNDSSFKEFSVRTHNEYPERSTVLFVQNAHKEVHIFSRNTVKKWLVCYCRSLLTWSKLIKRITLS